MATIVVVSFAASYWEVNLLPVLVAAGLLNLLVYSGLPQLRSTPLAVHTISAFVLLLLLIHPHWLRVSWLFLKSGLFGVGGSYGILAFLHQGAVEKYHWVSVTQLLDGLTLSIALPGSLTVFSTFVGFLAGGTRGAILGTFCVFAPTVLLVIAGNVNNLSCTDAIRSFLAGAGAAIVGAVIFIIFDIAPVAFVGTVTVAVAISTFLATALLNIEITLVAALSFAGALLYAAGSLSQTGLAGTVP
jgi:chromate transport protein ChrA